MPLTYTKVMMLMSILMTISSLMIPTTVHMSPIMHDF